MRQRLDDDEHPLPFSLFLLWFERFCYSNARAHRYGSELVLHGVSIGPEGKLQLGFTPPPCLCTTVPWFTYV